MRISYRRPPNISNIKYTFIKTQLTIKLFISLLLTAVKFQLIGLIKKTLGNIDTTYLNYIILLLSKFFIQHNTVLVYTCSLDDSSFTPPGSQAINYTLLSI